LESEPITDNLKPFRETARTMDLSLRSDWSWPGFRYWARWNPMKSAAVRIEAVTTMALSGPSET
jgi:hypothetical protein